MGSNKMLLPIGGLPVIEHCIKGLQSVCNRVIVVVGTRLELFESLRNAYPEVCFVVNNNPDHGMFSSVVAGLRFVQESRAFILPGDCPLVPVRVLRTMLTCRGCTIPVYHGLPGHPVLVDRIAMEGMLHSNTGSLRQYLFENGYERLDVDDDRILMDIDDTSAYREACDRYDHDCNGGG